MPPSQLARTLCLFALLATPSSADEATSPHFLVNGYPLGDARTHLDASETRAYRRALAAFPTAAASLKDGSDPVTATLNLEAFSNLKELEVCLFLTADTLRDLEGMRALLERSGFGYMDNNPHPMSHQQMNFYGAEGDGLMLNGIIPSPSLPSLGFGLTRFIWGDKHIGIGIVLGQHHQPVSVSANLNVL